MEGDDALELAQPEPQRRHAGTFLSQRPRLQRLRRLEHRHRRRFRGLILGGRRPGLT